MDELRELVDSVRVFLWISSQHLTGPRRVAARERMRLALEAFDQAATRGAPGGGKVPPGARSTTMGTRG